MQGPRPSSRKQKESPYLGGAQDHTLQQAKALSDRERRAGEHIRTLRLRANIEEVFPIPIRDISTRSKSQDHPLYFNANSLSFYSLSPWKKYNFGEYPERKRPTALFDQRHRAGHDLFPDL